jgi:hypothetical protein
LLLSTFLRRPAEANRWYGPIAVLVKKKPQIRQRGFFQNGGYYVNTPQLGIVIEASTPGGQIQFSTRMPF